VHRRRGALLVTVSLLLAAACSGGGGDRGSGADAPQPAPTTTSTTLGVEPELDAVPLVVVEQGFSTFPDPVDPEAELGGYGVVVENPNPEALATGVTVQTRLLAADGTVLFSDTALLNGVMPGARMAAGGTLLEPVGTPAAMDVSVDVAAWTRPAHDVALVAEGVLTEPEAGGGAITRFTVSSGWPAEEEGVDVVALYRAADGRILAAEPTVLPAVPANGSVEGMIRLLAPIPDLAVTEVLVGRGFSAQTSG
jgi:hypothetical protein